MVVANEGQHQTHDMLRHKSASGRIFRKLLHIKDRKFTSMATVHGHIDPLNVIVRKNVGSLYRTLFRHNKLASCLVLCLYFYDSVIFRHFQFVLL